MRAIDRFEFRSHLDAYWLRPESALWDAAAAQRLAPLLRGKEDIVEIGIGNGNFSFLMLGGAFNRRFDWFLNTSTEGFWNNADIYDCDADVGVEALIDKRPATRIRYGLDHKRNLLNQADRLGFVDELIEHDCNRPLPVSDCAVAYSNILYWLNDPLQTVSAIGNALRRGGELVMVFPNSDFYRHCQSYASHEAIWTSINRGRASHIMWHMDLPEFERAIEDDGLFEIALAEKYLCPAVLRVWDIGLRPLSVPLIKMANALSVEKRLEIKQEWCDTVERFAEPLLAMEMETAARHGGFNLVKLVRR